MLLLVTASAVARFAAATGVAVPWIAPDEPLYGLVGRSLVGEHTVLATAAPHVSLVTPALAGLPSLLTDDVGYALGLTQALQALVMSTAAAVVFQWARPLAGERWAFAAAVLAVIAPGMAYAGLLMTEAVFYPVMALALWSLARLATEPSAGRHLVFVMATVLAVMTRLQALSLVPVAATALLAAGLHTQRRNLVRAAGAYVFLTVVGGAVVATLAASGYAVLGAYTSTVTGGYALGAVVQDVWWHAGGLVLLSAGIPLVALGALLPLVRRRSHPSAELVALVTVGGTWLLALVLQVGAFASQHVGHVAERDLLSALPPVLVALAVWCHRGGGSPAWTAAVALAVAVPAVMLPIGRLATNEAMLDAFSTIALRKLAEHASVGTLEAVWPCAVAAAVAIPVACAARERLRPVALAATATALLVLSSFAQSDVRRASVADERWWFGDGSPRWIDRNADGPVTWLQAGTRNWGGAWKTAFWNRRVERVVRLPGTGLPGPMPAALVAPRFDGRLLTTDGDAVPGPYVAAPVGLDLVGREVARTGPSGDLAGIALWRVDGPPRLSSWRLGLEPNGDLAGIARIQLWDCRGGRLEVTLLGKLQETLVAFDVAGGSRSALPIGPNQVKVATIALPATGGRCDVTISSRALVGTTRIERFG